jgi:hypothetical protein
MIVILTGAPDIVSVPVTELPWMRTSICALGLVPTRWTLLAPASAAAAFCRTSADDLLSRPLVGVLVAVVAPPHAPAVRVISAAIAVAAVKARARRISFIEIIPLADALRPYDD